MTNSNCLKNIKCPKCDNHERFFIEANALFTVTDDGTDDYCNVQWNDDSHTECPDCLHFGTIRDFTITPFQPYFCGPSGTRYHYPDIAVRIRKEAPHTLGKHISVQLEAIGLLEEMKQGTTPYGLPFTFAEVP
jgi:hypothetical protein